ncbi:SDR family NAD(P)-dependent oxidoreductase [Solicola gregarius]|uniref:SDR family oxidoreductase n=1 Tax=Solicola gregarius TaxID=2908642 RepID=A0AA46TF38_9ACTN|nr:SDR family oxidoreductase [Solicola gregarius]UYM03647.1 SDR family oxidoreductase [Solicola gregarius]
MGSWARGATVAVTGASSGIGRAVACRLATAGATVLAVARRGDELSALAAEFADAGGGLVVPVVADVTDPATPRRLSAVLEQHSGRLDGLVNCAGLARFASIDSADLEDLDRMLAVNVRAPAALIQVLLPALRAADGSVVTVTSIGGVVAMPDRALYGASKAAANSLTRSLAHELAPGVRVNAVVPGAVDTPMYADLGLDEKDTAALREGLLRTTPMGRFGQPDDVAGYVCTLLDPHVSGWVTGALVTIDGGRSA